MVLRSGDPSKRFKLSAEVMGNGAKFLKGNTLVSILTWGEDYRPQAPNQES